MLLHTCKLGKNVFTRTPKCDNIFIRSLADVELKDVTVEQKKVLETAPKNVPLDLHVSDLKNVVLRRDTLLPPKIKQEVNTFVAFDEVPGPSILKHAAKLWSYIPMIGNQVTTSTIQYMLGSQLSWGRNSWIFKYMMDEYGPVVRLQSPFGGDVVILSRSEDALSVFSNEGPYPIRSSLDCIENYRLKHRQYKNVGPFLMYGQDWEKLRSKIEAPLQSTTEFQYKSTENVSDDFIMRIRQIRNRQEEVPNNFLNDIYKWSLECLCSVLLGRKFGLMDHRVTISNSESQRLLLAFHGATDAIKKCESGFHLWKFIETPAWKSLVKNCDIIDSILNKHIRDADIVMNSMKKNHSSNLLNSTENSILNSLLYQGGMCPEDILTVFLDMMLIGVNASAHSLAFLLYHLARNPRAQRKLSDEVRAAPESLNAEKLKDFKYLQACIKESLRLKPPIPFLSRILTRDIIVHNYKIPKGTVILMATYLSSLREENFDDALKFIPERWLSTEMHGDSSFASIPFGYGPKACLAKNLAEMQLSLMIIKILRAFRIEYHYGNINSTTKMLSTPDRDLKFRFINRFNI